jgi:hypothetical protein
MKDGMPKLTIMYYQFEVFVKNYLPVIYKKFEYEDISI